MVWPAASAANDEVLLVENGVDSGGIGAVFHLQVLVARSLVHCRVHVLFLLVCAIDQTAIVNVKKRFIVVFQELVDIGSLVGRVQIGHLKITHQTAFHHFFR